MPDESVLRILVIRRPVRRRPRPGREPRRATDGGGPVGPTHPADGDRAGADQWTSIAETGRGDPRPPAERQRGVLGQRLLRRVEERRSEAERHGAADDHQIEVQQVAHGGHGDADELAGALHDLVRRLRGRAPGDRQDRRPRCLGLQATARTAGASPTVGLDDDVPDVAGVARSAVEQLAIEHDPPSDTCGHDHRQEVLLALCGAEPTLGEGQRLGVEVAVDRQAGGLLHPLAQREAAPRGDVQRRHLLGVHGERAGAADADDDRVALVVAAGPLQLRLDHHVERLVQRFGVEVVVHRGLFTVDQLALHGHQADGHLRAADVDDDGDVARCGHRAQPTRRAASTRLIS